MRYHFNNKNFFLIGGVYGKKKAWSRIKKAKRQGCRGHFLEIFFLDNLTNKIQYPEKGGGRL
jgi:hypothetical protein